MPFDRERCGVVFAKLKQDKDQGVRSAKLETSSLFSDQELNVKKESEQYLVCHNHSGKVLAVIK